MASTDENASLVGPPASGGGGRKRNTPDWGRFGLSDEQRMESQGTAHEEHDEVFEQHHEGINKNELYSEDQSGNTKPWWRSNFFVSEPVLFGSWDGVFTSCMINIFGVVIFLRTGWMVGNAGIGLSILIIFMTISVALIAALSAIGVCERCNMESGGVYFLLSHVLGARIGASVGILYCFGQAVACSLYVVGFGESVAALFGQDNVWISRAIGAGIILLLLGINVAGVKWVIRLQLILLIVLFVAMLDFLVGSFVHDDPVNSKIWDRYNHTDKEENGFLGYNTFTLQNNTGPSYLDGESFFTVFGVFFPTATGVFAGINMSGDLRNPQKNIPQGTLSAVGVSTLLYLIFAIVLGATCTRSQLQTDYMIAEKVSVVGVLFLAGLYISSISSCMGGLYGSPRILQCIASENVIPILKFLAKGRGPNKVPVYALVVITVISLIFVFIGKVNTLGPIVTMPFMITYAAVDYAYFCLAMSYEKKKQRELRYEATHSNSYHDDMPKSASGSISNGGYGYGSIKKNGDLDSLFPERIPRHERRERQDSLGSPTFVSDPADPKNTVDAGMDVGVDDGVDVDAKSETQSVAPSEVDDTAELIKKQQQAKRLSDQITRQPRSFYSIFCNRWLSLIGAFLCFLIMFCIQWGYALVAICLTLLVYVYIGQANPGVFPGICEFSTIEWIREGFARCCRRGPPPPEQIVVTPNTPAMSTMAAQLTEDNEDFAERGRYHQSEIVKGENFDDPYDST